MSEALRDRLVVDLTEEELAITVAWKIAADCERELRDAYVSALADVKDRLTLSQVDS